MIGSFIDERFKYSKDKKASSFVSFDVKVTQMKMIENKNIFINMNHIDKAYIVYSLNKSFTINKYAFYIPNNTAHNPDLSRSADGPKELYIFITLPKHTVAVATI